jgi:Fic/DOC family protein
MLGCARVRSSARGLSAALFESLLMNHPFVDGNKRVAFFATDVFLRLNGWRLEVDADKAHRFLIRLLERGECDFQHLLPWVRRSLATLTKRSGRRTHDPPGWLSYTVETLLSFSGIPA